MDNGSARHAVAASIDSVTPIVTMSREGLVIIALRWRVPGGEYEVGAVAAKTGGLEVREQGGGSVPTIEALTGAKPVVVFAGDTLVGGRQNRVINVSVWLPAGSITAIPVSCLEHGRWNEGDRFAASRKADYGLRAMMSAQFAAVAAAEVACSGSATRSYAGDQFAVWREIAAKEARAAAHSGTAALHDLYAREADDLVELRDAFPYPAGASGLAVGIGGKLVAAELFDATETARTEWPRLVEAAASAYIDHVRAIDVGAVGHDLHRYPDVNALGRMLKRARDAAKTAIVAPSVGEGLDVRLVGSGLRGAALVVHGHPVHVELFRVAA